MAQNVRRTNRRTNSSYDRYIQNNYYAYTSQAHQLAEEAYPLEYEDDADDIRPARPVRKVPRPAKKHRKKVQRGTPKAKPVVIIQMENKRILSPMGAMLLVVVFAGFFLCVAARAHTADRRLTLTSLQSDLKALTQENIELQKDLYEGYDLAEIELYATARLGMVKPEEHQIRTISVPKQSFSVQYDNTMEEPQVGFSFAGLMNLFIKD